MAQIQDYQVNYDISVKADGIDKITDFANAISKLKMSKETAESSVKNVQTMMDKLNVMFRPKGKLRDIKYNVTIRTDLAEDKLNNILNLITNIQKEAANINLVINAGQKLDSQAIRAQAKAVLKNQELAAQEEAKKSSKKTSYGGYERAD